MKALTLHQPWASLIAVGAKTIETRPRGTTYRGPIAIHAAKRRPEDHWPWPDGKPFTMWLDEFGERVLQRYEFSDPNTVTSYEAWPMPLGAVVASARLVDVVPIVADYESVCGAYDGPAALEVTPNGTLTLYPEWASALYEDDERDVCAERPFGDFSPGRFAWLLEDVASTTERCPWCWGRGYFSFVGPEDVGCTRPCAACGGTIGADNGAGHCDPIPARGQQATPWEWTPVISPSVEGKDEK